MKDPSVPTTKQRKGGGQKPKSRKMLILERNCYIVIYQMKKEGV